MRVLMTGGGTGGHVNPAIAIANTIKAREPSSEIAFVGTSAGIENKLVAAAGYPLYHVEVQGIRRRLTLENIKTMWLAWTSVFKAKKLVREFKPDVVIGTGGYVSWPVVKAASQLGIPTALHESNAVPGFAVKMLEKYTDVLFVNFEETIKELKYPEKAVRVGNPLKNEFSSIDYAAAREKLGITGKYRYFILSCGGSMGAERVNDEVLAMMKSFVSKHPEIYHVHATGAIEHEAATAKFREEGLDKFPNLELVEYIYDMPVKMAAADVVINRAGAMTLSELALMKKPCVLIPSPNVTNNHQYKNAKVLADSNAAVLLEESAMSDGTLANTVEGLLRDPNLRREMSENIGKYAITDACDKIYAGIEALLREKAGKNASVTKN